MNEPCDDLLELIGRLVIGDKPYGAFRGSKGGAPLFAKAGWSVTESCPPSEWETWASLELRQFCDSDSDAIAKVLRVMAAPEEFLDTNNRIQEKAREQQVDLWNGFLAPHGLRIVAHASGATIERCPPGYLRAASGDRLETRTPGDAISIPVRLLQERYGKNCVFIMHQFGGAKPTSEMITTIRKTLERRGFQGLTATDAKFEPTLWANLLIYLHACRAGIAVFERLESDAGNPNVCLEAGYMIALGKKVGLLKERTLTTLPSDLSGHLWNPFDIHEASSIANAVEAWLRDDHLLTPV
jgi:hypothetical protein